MIKSEIKVVIPDNKTKEDFLKQLLAKSSEVDTLFWQLQFDICEMERASFEAVLGEEGFPFLEANTVLSLSFDCTSKKEAKKICDFFETLAISWEIEINQFYGERIFSDLVDLDDSE